MTTTTTTEKRGPGRPPRGLTEAFELLVTPEMLAQLDEAAERDGVPRTEWVRQAIAARLRRAK